MVLAAFLTVLSYLAGSISTGAVLARARGLDIQAVGSGNIGATNVYRTLGRWHGALTLAGDILKGFVPTLAAANLLSCPWSVAAVGIAAVAGHCWPIFLRFRGGKAVATTAGVFLAIGPVALLPAVVIFVAVVAGSRFVSLASMAASAAIPLSILAGNALGFTDYPAASLALGVAAALLVFGRHQENIRRLAAGTEPRFGETGGA